MVQIVAPLAFVESLPEVWAHSARQLISGNMTNLEGGVLREMFRYDLQCMYREGRENDDQDERVMPAYGTLVAIAFYTESDVNVFLSLDLYNGIFKPLAGFNPVLVPGNSLVNMIYVPKVAGYHIKGEAQKVTPADPDTNNLFSVQITDY